jgi:hypothetical protein
VSSVLPAVEDHRLGSDLPHDQVPATHLHASRCENRTPRLRLQACLTRERRILASVPAGWGAAACADARQRATAERK